METPFPLQTHSKSWPPERGWPLFLAWMGGIMLMQILNGVAVAAVFSSIKASEITWQARVPMAILAIIGHAWQAWLLFSRYPGRFAFWTLLPAVGFLTPATLKVFQYVSLVVPLVEAAILRGVRLRAWAWILAGMAGVLLTQLSFWYMFSMNGHQTIERFVADRLGTKGTQTLVSLGTSAILQGFWLLGEVISAAVLAWKMPPVTSSESVPPPQSV
jgi:hypothetical protein